MVSLKSSGKSGLVSIQANVSSALDVAKNLVTAHPISTGVAAATTVGAIGVVVGRKMSKSRRKTRKKSRKSKRLHSRKRHHSHSHRRRRRTPRTAGKRRDTSHRRIRYTKRGQPYIIQGNGKARFISNRSAKVSRKRKGGKY